MLLWFGIISFIVYVEIIVWSRRYNEHWRNLNIKSASVSVNYLYYMGSVTNWTRIYWRRGVVCEHDGLMSGYLVASPYIASGVRGGVYSHANSLSPSRHICRSTESFNSPWPSPRLALTTTVFFSSARPFPIPLAGNFYGVLFLILYWLDVLSAFILGESEVSVMWWAIR